MAILLTKTPSKIFFIFFGVLFFYSGNCRKFVLSKFTNNIIQHETTTRGIYRNWLVSNNCFRNVYSLDYFSLKLDGEIFYFFFAVHFENSQNRFIFVSQLIHSSKFIAR